jgi:hypothetical protein
MKVINKLINNRLLKRLKKYFILEKNNLIRIFKIKKFKETTYKY